MAEAVDAGVLALLKGVLAIAPKRGVRVTRAPDGTVTVSVYMYAPAQHMRRAACCCCKAEPIGCCETEPTASPVEAAPARRC